MGYNVGLATMWVYAVSLGIIPKCIPETIGFTFLILDEMANLSLY